MSDHPKGSGALFPNREKTAQNHPDFRGNIELTKEQLDRLYEMGRAGIPVKLQVSGWKRKAKESGMPYLSLETEAYMKTAQAPQDDWGQPQGGFRGAPQQQAPQRPRQAPQDDMWGAPQQPQRQAPQQAPQQSGWTDDGFVDDDVPF